MLYWHVLKEKGGNVDFRFFFSLAKSVKEKPDKKFNVLCMNTPFVRD